MKKNSFVSIFSFVRFTWFETRRRYSNGSPFLKFSIEIGCWKRDESARISFKLRVKFKWCKMVVVKRGRLRTFIARDCRRTIFDFPRVSLMRNTGRRTRFIKFVHELRMYRCNVYVLQSIRNKFINRLVVRVRCESSKCRRALKSGTYEILLWITILSTPVYNNTIEQYCKGWNFSVLPPPPPQFNGQPLYTRFSPTRAMYFLTPDQTPTPFHPTFIRVFAKDHFELVDIPAVLINSEPDRR